QFRRPLPPHAPSREVHPLRGQPHRAARSGLPLHVPALPLRAGVRPPSRDGQTVSPLRSLRVNNFGGSTGLGCGLATLPKEFAPCSPLLHAPILVRSPAAFVPTPLTKSVSSASTPAAFRWFRSVRPSTTDWRRPSPTLRPAAAGGRT